MEEPGLNISMVSNLLKGRYQESPEGLKGSKNFSWSSNKVKLINLYPCKFYTPPSIMCVFDTFSNNTRWLKRKYTQFLWIIHIFSIQGSPDAALGEIPPDARRPHTWHYTIIKDPQQTQGLDAKFPIPGKENWCFFQIRIPTCVFCVQCLVLELLSYQISEEVIRTEVIKCYFEKWELWWKQWIILRSNF